MNPCRRMTLSLSCLTGWVKKSYFLSMIFQIKVKAIFTSSGFWEVVTSNGIPNRLLCWWLWHISHSRTMLSSVEKRGQDEKHGRIPFLSLIINKLVLHTIPTQDPFFIEKYELSAEVLPSLKACSRWWFLKYFLILY